MANRSSWRVLICDDDPQELRNLYELFAEYFEVIAATSGMEALEKLDLYEPDLIILDMHLKGVDGISTCRAIRKNSRFCGVPVFMITQDGKVGSAEELEALEVKEVLSRPFDNKKMIDTVDHYLNCASIEIQQKKYSITAIQEREGDSFWSWAKNSQPQESKSGWSSIDEDISKDQSQVKAKAKDPVSRNEIRIAVIDDGDSTDEIKDSLKEEFQVHEISNSINAIQELKKTYPDFLFINNRNAGISGFQMLQLLRMNPDLASIRVILIGDSCDFEEVEYGLSLGAIDTLQKPLVKDVVIECIDAALEKPYDGSQSDPDLYQIIDEQQQVEPSSI